MSPSRAALSHWYRLTTPGPPTPAATQAAREQALRARFLSTLVLVSVLWLVFTASRAILHRDPALLLVIGQVMLLEGLAIALNRRGAEPTWAISLIVTWFGLRLGLSFFAIPGRLGVANLTNLFLLIAPEVYAITLLPTWSVFLVALGNCVLTTGLIALRPHSGELDRLLGVSGYDAILQPIGVQLAVALIVYLWMRSALQAAERATQAEELARLTRTEQRVKLAYEHEHQLNELKDQFLLNVSHELRTPLTALGGYLELLQRHREDVDPAELEQLLTQAQGNQEELVNLVNRVLDAVAVVGDVPPARCEVIELGKVVRGVLGSLDRSQVEAYRIRVPVDDEILVWADPQHLRQVLRNLLGNVFKYVPPGTEVWIEAGRPEPPSPVHLSVRDAGPGIPPEELPLLFQKFVRLSKDLAGPVSGTGLGLYICRRLMESMGGRIWAESSGRPGAGSRFTLTLPLPPLR